MSSDVLPQGPAAAHRSADRPVLPPLPALVVGEVTHSRREPIRRRFSHGLYQWLVDVDDLPRQPRLLRPLAGFRAADHLGDPGSTLRENVTRFVAAHGVDLGPGSRIVMLASARVLGHVFNPISVFWCLHPDGEIAAVVAEVHNTYAERHAYFLLPDEGGSATTEKVFYVSPFFDVQGSYTLRFELSPERVSASVTLHREGRVPFAATFAGRPVPATPRAVLAQNLRRPLQPQQVTLLIRMHGIWLWLRRLPVVSRPAHAPQEGV